MSDFENGAVSSLLFHCCDWIRGGTRRVCLSFFQEQLLFFSYSDHLCFCRQLFHPEETGTVPVGTWLDKCGTGVLLVPIAIGLVRVGFVLTLFYALS